MRRTAGLLLIGIVVAVSAMLATRPTPDPLDAPSDAESSARADAGLAASAALGADLARPVTPSDVRVAPVDRTSPTPAIVPKSPDTAAAGLARAPNGRAPVVPARASPAPDAASDAASDAGSARPPASATSLPFVDPPTFSARAFVRNESLPRDLRTIVGSVLRPDGAPFVGATVRVVERLAGEERVGDRPIDPASLLGRRVLGLATTDAKGEFGFNGVDVDQVIAVVDRSPGLAHATARPRLGSRLGPASVVLRPSWRTVLRVTDPEGAAVPRADVAFFDGVGPVAPLPPGARPREPMCRAFADRRGEVEFLGGPAPRTEGRLVVTPDGGGPAVLAREIERFTFADATIVVARAHTVRGVVRDRGPVRATEGRPLREVAAWFRVEGVPWAPIEFGDDGAFTLRGLARGPVRLLAHPKDLRAFDEAARELVVAAGAEDVVVDVDPGETLEVRVEDLVAPPSGASVRGNAWWKLHGAEASSTTVAYGELDGDGVAAIRGVRPGDSLDLFIPQAGTGERCVYETGLSGATRRVAVKTKPLVELDGRIEGAEPEMWRRSRLSARADGWEFGPSAMTDRIHGYVPPVASLSVAFATRWPTGGGTWETAEGHADVDPRRPFTLRVETVAKK